MYSKLNIMYVITYLESGGGRIEGLIENFEDFPKWLEQHNEDRKENCSYINEDGERVYSEDFVEETENDFGLTRVKLFKP